MAYRSIQAVVLAIGSALSADAGALETNTGFDLGVLSAGPGKGGMTLGINAAAGGRADWLPDWMLVTGRGSVAVLGIVGDANPGVDARLSLTMAATSSDMWAELGAGGDFISYRACGALNCGRITGLVPSAALRFVRFGPFFDRALGLAASASAHLVNEPLVTTGVNWAFSFGPLWRLGRR